jgi:pyruvate dehydrogenase E2 component (dihydrolipoamide acetyltransferase)
MIDFCMPSLGADMENGTLRDWLVKPGDKVKPGDIIAVVETQKGLIDIEVFDEGTIEQLVTREGEEVPVGSVMAVINPSVKELHLEPAELQSAIRERPEERVPEPLVAVNIAAARTVRASPLAKRIAGERGIDLSAITGTGDGGAITKEDVERFILKAETTTEVVEKKASPQVSTESIRMAVAAAMSKSNKEIPHYYLETKVDMSKAMAWLAETNKARPIKKRILPVALLLKAVAKAIRIAPDLNSYWNNGLQRKEDIHIGFVISLRTGGLMIPAIHNTDKKSVEEIMEALWDIIPRARDLKLRSSELSDSTITVTNLGEGEAETLYGIIYPPQVALVGFGAITEQPWAENGMLGVRPVLSITLAADHRATDGQTGSRFLTTFKNLLQKPGEL